jgi:hypothetical protein
MDNELTMDPTQDELSEWESLSDRQKEMAENNAEIVLQFGMFKQDSSPDGAHYFDGSKNPFGKEGIKCNNCIFFNEAANQCIIVEGSIDPEGLCKLWVIPQDELTETTQQENQKEYMNTEKRDFNAKERQHLADTGAAMKDGSYPIRNAQDLHNAIQSFGRASDPEAVKAHIKARAEALGLTNELPDSWKTTTKSIWEGSFNPNIITKGIL